MRNKNLKVCPACWRGTLAGGVCPVCHWTVTAEASRCAHALPLETTLQGRYLIGQVLGSGGFGITYSAWDQKAGQRVAIKELYPQNLVFRGQNHLTVTPTQGKESELEILKNRFQQEASFLLELQGEKNLVKVFDLFSCNGTVCYSMEFLEGTDLRNHLKKYGPMDWNTLAPMLRDLLQTLSNLHAKKLIHRDISPDNLFLTTDHSLHLIDFGSVRTYQGNRKFTVYLKNHFSPWEQSISNGNQGPWTDIYALSVTIYYLLSGKLPPKSEERMDGAAVPPLKALVPAVPEQVSAALEKGMAMSIEDRIPDAAHLAMALGLFQPPLSQGKGNVFWLQGRTGIYAGRRRALEVGMEIHFGRAVNCHVSFPENTRGDSRKQCSIFVRQDGAVLIKDDGSSYGTFLNGQKVPNGWIPVPPGSILQFGNETFRLLATHSINKGNTI